MTERAFAADGRRRKARAHSAALLATLVAACAPSLLWSQPSGPLVYSATVDALIHPVSAGFMIDTMDRADRDGAALLVFTLRTPGGLLDSTHSIVSHMLSAKTPVAVFVGPGKRGV